MNNSFLLTALLLAGLASGCGKKAEGPHLVVVNQTGQDLMEVQIGSGGDSDWSENALAAEYLADGKSSSVVLPPDWSNGPCALRAIDADGREIAWPAAPLTNGQEIILRRPESGRAPDTK